MSRETISELTPKERWLATIRLEPVDRLPFWPKLDAAYPPARRGPFNAMGIEAIHDWIGSDKHVWMPQPTKDVHARCAVEHTRQGHTRRVIFRTPFGDLEGVDAFDAPSMAWHPIKFPVERVQDVKALTAYYEDTRVELDPDVLADVEQRVAGLGQDAVTATSIGTSPLMQWVEHLAGIERAHYLLIDHPAIVETLFDAMHRVTRDRAEVVAQHSPADILYMTENTSTTLTSPAQYMRYCYPHITDYGRIARKHGRLMALHMCGHLRLLLPELATLPVDAFEAFTTPTLGDATLLDGRTNCPDKCLIGGTNAMLWTRPADEIIRQIERDLARLPHHRGVAITSAGVMPPLCEPETIRAVCDWVKTYPARV